MRDTQKARPKSGMGRLLELAGTNKPLIACAGIFSALASVVSFVPYLAIYYVIREMLMVYPDFARLNVARALSLGWVALGGVIANVLLYFAALMCSHLAAFGTLFGLKVRFASHITRLPLGFHLLYGSGRLRKVMDENIEKIEGFIAHQFPDLVASMTAPLVMLGVLLYFDWRFGLAALAGVSVAFALEFKAYGNEGSKTMMKKYQDTMEDMNSATVEYIRGISVVKAFRQTVYSFRRLHESIRRYTEFVIPYTLSWENLFTGFMVIINNLYLFLLPVGIWIGLHTQDYAAYAMSFIFYLLFAPSVATVMMKIMYVSSASMQISGGVERMDEVLARPELPETDMPRTCSGSQVEFRGVSFSYEAAEEKQALQDVSFLARQGQVTAVVGPSGGGKSTIAHLIPRFYDVNRGQILIGGTDIRDMKLSYLMEQVSFVFQDVFLFKQSVMDNIRIGNRDATDLQVMEAAKAAQCHEFIQRLPQGYHTVIGTRGVHLSGGERQRLAIARAIVKDAPILVLDEATAFADPENEHLIQKAFEKLMRGKTVIIIAHRLSTVRGANQILVMDKGRLAESGTHEALLAAGGRYHDMWEMFSRSLDWSMGTERGVSSNA